MEQRLNKKLEGYVISFKENLKKKLVELQFSEREKVNEFLEYLNEYERIILEKDDLIKRNRLQNAIPDNNRCIAKLQNEKQCTRKKKNDCSYCGTHSINIPFGSVIVADESVANLKVNVFAVNIKGIVYYIDKSNNVYNTEDILEEKENPRIISKATCENKIYHIPSFGI
jgi:hypothetical protein